MCIGLKPNQSVTYVCPECSETSDNELKSLALYRRALWIAVKEGIVNVKTFTQRVGTRLDQAGHLVNRLIAEGFISRSRIGRGYLYKVLTVDLDRYFSDDVTWTFEVARAASKNDKATSNASVSKEFPAAGQSLDDIPAKRRKVSVVSKDLAVL